MRGLIASVMMLTATVASAGEFNEVLSIGDKAPTWTDLPGVDGKSHSLKDWDDRDALVVVFTCASCPTAVDYEGRLNELAKQSGNRFAVIAICVNKVAGDRLPDLTKRAKEKELVFPYLHDESQEIAKKFGAVFTPECYVLDKERRVIFMGPLDDSTDAANVKVRYVEEAVVAVLKGEKPAVTEVIARGCRIRYARERRAQ